MSKVFVASISWNTNENGLRNHFSQVGTVEEAIIIKDRETKRSKGFGFVTFSNQDEANRAVQELDNSMLDGKTLRVNFAKERERR
jgi:cold-inducible RNA-binding protein